MNKLIIRVLRKLKLLKLFNLQFNINVNNIPFKVPIVKGIGLDNIYGTEPWMIQLLTKIFSFKNEGAYYDVGVNVGQTLIKLKSVNPNIEYIGFEPNPICVFYSKELIKINNFKSTSIFPVGISNEDAIYSLSLYSNDDTDSAASMIENFRDNNRVVKKEYIPCFKIDEISAKYKLPKICVLKIDVEGAEKEVLQSFEQLIKRDKPLIQIEILPVYNEKNIDRLTRQNAIETLMKNLDYSICRVLKTSDGHFKNLEEITTIGIHDNLDLCEYVLVHSSNKEKIKQSFNQVK